MSNLPILEKFLSIQGEGKYIGEPSIFARFINCNLSCPHCDSKFTWNEEGKCSIEETVEFIKESEHKFGYSHLTITGGEPLLHQEEIIEMLHSLGYYLLKNKLKITIETNCTILPRLELVDMMRFYKGLWSVSPKPDYIYEDIIEFFTHQNTQFKFVIVKKIDKEVEIINKFIEGRLINKLPIILQPDGNRRDYDVACRELAEYVISNNLTDFRVLPQFHRICWGNKRGV